MVAPPTDDLDQLPLFVPATEINIEALRLTPKPCYELSTLNWVAIWPLKLFSREPPPNLDLFST